MEKHIASEAPRTRPQPFRIAVDEAILEDLGRRLRATRWPDEVPHHAPWQLGADLTETRSLAEYWRDGYNWRTQEAALNQLPQFVIELDDVRLHYIHIEGRGPRPVPLLLPHGWPSSIAELRHIIPMLADPVRFGGDPVDAFTVVAPSLPGHGFSYAPGQRRLSIPGIADLLAKLMTKVLGYTRFGVQGGDWGAFIATRLGHVRPDALLGIHLSLLAIPREVPSGAAVSSPDEQRFFAQLAAWLREETGYIQIMGTKPQTLAYALHDSPVGLLAWILEKWRMWTDCGGDVQGTIGRDNLLTNVMLYWATGAIGSSFWPYYARLHEPWIVPPGGTVPVPTGYAEFPKDFLHPPRSLAERTYTDIRRWTSMPRGGHFPAIECPEALTQEIRAFFRPLREAVL